MTQENFVALVMRSLPELEQEEKDFPGVKESFIADSKRMHAEGWSVADSVRYCRLTEEVNCWFQEEDGTWRHRSEEEMVSEDAALAVMSQLSKKYRK